MWSYNSCPFECGFFLKLTRLHQVIVAAYGIFSCGMRNLVPWPGSEPEPPTHWERRVLAMGPPGKSLTCSFFHLASCSPGLPMLWHMSVLHAFLWLSITPLCVYTTFCKFFQRLNKYTSWPISQPRTVSFKGMGAISLKCKCQGRLCPCLLVM